MRLTRSRALVTLTLLRTEALYRFADLLPLKISCSISTAWSSVSELHEEKTCDGKNTNQSKHYNQIKYDIT